MKTFLLLSVLASTSPPVQDVAEVPLQLQIVIATGGQAQVFTLDVTADRSGSSEFRQGREAAVAASPGRLIEMWEHLVTSSEEAWAVKVKLRVRARPNTGSGGSQPPDPASPVKAQSSVLGQTTPWSFFVTGPIPL